MLLMELVHQEWGFCTSQVCELGGIVYALSAAAGLASVIRIVMIQEFVMPLLWVVRPCWWCWRCMDRKQDTNSASAE